MVSAFGAAFLLTKCILYGLDFVFKKRGGKSVTPPLKEEIKKQLEWTS